MNVVSLSSDIMRSIRNTLREVVFSHDFLKCYICSEQIFSRPITRACGTYK